MAQTQHMQPPRPPRPVSEGPHDIGTEDYPAIFLQGTWVGSASGFIHADPPRAPATNTPVATELPPPQLGGYFRRGDGTFFQWHGYELIASVLCLRFLPGVRLRGRLVFNRGGRWVIAADDLRGEYSTVFSPQLQVIHGNFNTEFTTQTGQVINQEYYFVLKDENEMRWLWLSQTRDGAADRGTVMEGTLTRVPYRASRE